MMTMTTPEHDPADPLSLYFDAARRAAPVPSDALMARIMNDAAHAHDPVPHTAARQRAATPLSWLRRALADLTRRPLAGAAGMAVVALCGLWLGVAAPGPVAQVELLLWGGDGYSAPDGELELLLAELTPDFGDMP